jgi:hypothetical protein
MQRAYAWIRNVPHGSGMSKPDHEGLGILRGTIAAAWRTVCIRFAVSFS